MLLGVVLQGISINFQMFVAARFFLGFGVAIAHGASPLLITELVHPQREFSPSLEPPRALQLTETPRSRHLHHHLQHDLVCGLHRRGLVDIRHESAW
jgi:hypothetical protein